MVQVFIISLGRSKPRQQGRPHGAANKKRVTNKDKRSHTTPNPKKHRKWNYICHLTIETELSKLPNDHISRSTSTASLHCWIRRAVKEISTLGPGVPHHTVPSTPQPAPASQPALVSRWRGHHNSYLIKSMSWPLNHLAISTLPTQRCYEFLQSCYRTFFFLLSSKTLSFYLFAESLRKLLSNKKNDYVDGGHGGAVDASQRERSGLEPAGRLGPFSGSLVSSYSPETSRLGLPATANCP